MPQQTPSFRSCGGVGLCAKKSPAVLPGPRGPSNADRSRKVPLLPPRPEELLLAAVLSRSKGQWPGRRALRKRPAPLSESSALSSPWPPGDALHSGHCEVQWDSWRIGLARDPVGRDGILPGRERTPPPGHLALGGLLRAVGAPPALEHPAAAAGVSAQVAGAKAASFLFLLRPRHAVGFRFLQRHQAARGLNARATS